MKKTAFALVLVLVALVFTACGSLPGEQRVLRENSAAEYVTLADGYFSQEKYAKASEYYEKALQLTESTDTVCYKLACSYAYEGEYEKAMPLFSDLLDKDPQNRTIKESLAYVTVMSGDVRGGGELYEELAADFPEDGKLLKNYVLTLIQSKNFDAAEDKIKLYKSLFGTDSNSQLLDRKLQEALKPAEETPDES